VTALSNTVLVLVLDDEVRPGALTMQGGVITALDGAGGENIGGDHSPGSGQYVNRALSGDAAE
jgi:hypothetical protein